MKLSKTGLLFITAVAFFVLGGLAFGNDFGDAAVYFPMKPGNYWIYKLSMPGNSHVYEQKVKVDDSEGGKPEIIVYDPKGTPEVFVYYELNELGLFKSSEMASWGLSQYKPLWPVLKNKMAVGTSWNWQSADHKMTESVKVTAAEKVTVPAGTFEALLVECSGTNFNGVSYVDKTWYAKNIGYVKDELTMEGKSLVSELSEYQLGK
ncbi:MAG TPA: hypothetical protein DDW50_20720 [Firmicutes bacterium]|jgi:hypothetical protein|nr:hypothetical protein [Bacillota bacterium]